MYKFLKTKLDEAKAKDYSIIEKGGSTQYIMKDSSKVSGQRDITSPPPRPTRVRIHWDKVLLHMRLCSTGSAQLK